MKKKVSELSDSETVDNRNGGIRVRFWHSYFGQI